MKLAAKERAKELGYKMDKDENVIRDANHGKSVTSI